MTSQPPVIVSVADYDGEEEVRLRATQLGSDHTASAARRVVAEWVELFSAGPSPIRRLELTSRTPARLFAALSGQTQLESLAVKWGDYADLSPVSRMSSLQVLSLRGASKVTSVDALGGLVGLRSLTIEGFKEIVDPSPLGRLTALARLELGGNWTAPRDGHLPSIGFLGDLRGLTDLLLHTVVVDDRDYSPLLDLPALEKVRVMEVRGMSPSIEELRAALPWNG